ncbi:MAG TPA: hypothetical protein VHX67_10780 [Acidimicrobiales bacterium]|jgi:hypothetical protein|nr:hypothetical protein [Acidimicrobiales bacterium]
MDRHLDFEFEVGESERHNVAFEFDQLWGPLKISVDGKRVIKKLGMFSLKQTSRYEFSVGSSEPHEVRIEKSRKALLGGFQAQECVAYVDGEEVGRYSNAA